MTAAEREQIARLTEVVERIEAKVDDTATRVRGLEDAALLSKGRRQGEARILGLGKSSLALVLSVLAALATAGPVLGTVISGILHN